MKKYKKLFTSLSIGISAVVLIATIPLLSSCSNSNNSNENNSNLSPNINNINFTKLDNLYDSLNNYINESTKMYTPDEFSKDINTNLNNIKSLIAKNLYISDSQTFDESEINKISLDSQNNLEISLEQTDKEYSINENKNIVLDNNKLIIKNLRFYTLISVNENDLIKLWNNIQNLIYNDSITTDNINSYLSNQIYDLIKNIKTLDNKNLETFINVPTNSGANIEISLKDRFKLSKGNISNISINLNNIILQNFTLITSDDCFNFDSSKTEIIGLTKKGESQTNMVLPKRITSLADGVFLNSNINSIDLSLTSITSIPNNCFKSSYLKTINFPKNIETIGDNAFEFCKFTSIELPDTITSIGTKSFHWIEELETVKLSENLKTIGERAFSENPVLKEVIFPKNNLTSIGSYAFWNCGSLESALMPDSITLIDVGCFNGCGNLKNVNIPKNLTSISAYAFQKCNLDGGVVLPESLEVIDNYAFSNSGLTNVKIPDNVTYLGEYAFDNCRSMTSIQFSEKSKLKTISDSTFRFCTKIPEIKLPNSLQTIDLYSFQGCDELTSLIIPNSVTKIGQNAFVQCAKLTITVSNLDVKNLVTRSGFKGQIIEI